jgi:cyclophilin family peptidyl-prolyl cis-trans isomerase
MGRRTTVKHLLLLLSLAVIACTAAAPTATAANPVVVIETSMGNIKVELDEEKAPISVKNFLGYVDDKFYDGTIFHRVISGFMIQGGGFADGKEKDNKKPPIKNEARNGLQNKRGAIAMARTNDPDSATSQFFINHKDNPSLQPGGVSPDGYAVFGQVVEGLDVVDKIASVRTGVKRFQIQGMNAPMRDVPLEDVVIKSIKRVDK